MMILERLRTLFRGHQPQAQPRMIGFLVNANGLIPVVEGSDGTAEFARMMDVKYEHSESEMGYRNGTILRTPAKQATFYRIENAGSFDRGEGPITFTPTQDGAQ